jgi:hypothetical protein
MITNLRTPKEICGYAIEKNLCKTSTEFWTKCKNANRNPQQHLNFLLQKTEKNTEKKTIPIWKTIGTPLKREGMWRIQGENIPENWKQLLQENGVRFKEFENTGNCDMEECEETYEDPDFIEINDITKEAKAYYL